jgi:hypothetical protein
MNISYNDQWYGRGNTDGSGRNGINGEEPSEYELTAMREGDQMLCRPLEI